MSAGGRQCIRRHCSRNQNIYKCRWSSSQPYLVASISGGDSRSAAFHIATWRWHICTLSVNASVVGGMEQNFTDDAPLFPVSERHILTLYSVMELHDSYSNVFSLSAALKLTTLLSCSMHNTTSTELSIIMYCMLLWYTTGIIVLHIHTRVGTCSSFNYPVAIMVIPDTVWRHFWCDLQ